MPGATFKFALTDELTKAHRFLASSFRATGESAKSLQYVAAISSCEELHHIFL